jgi:DNA-binding transcriptional ArsR family regulator
MTKKESICAVGAMNEEAVQQARRRLQTRLPEERLQSVTRMLHQLRGLRALRLVKGRRDGKMTFYSLDDEHVLALLDVGLEHAREPHRSGEPYRVGTTS